MARIVQPSQVTLDEVNRLLRTPEISPIGAYALGELCAIAWNAGKEPPFWMLQGVTICHSLNESLSWMNLSRDRPA